MAFQRQLSDYLKLFEMFNSQTAKRATPVYIVNECNISHFSSAMILAVREKSLQAKVS